ncbi:MAG TPA: helix-turn-helix transcriptional regulator [Nitrospiraceae bacterium]|nr:helix-turn-helix transcriptional regulator [Nitrospiraceae bacterium]
MANTLLSPREREVLVFLWQGLTTREISRILHRSFNTIAMHRRHILKKLGVRTTTRALTIAQEQQLMKPSAKHE